MSYRNYIGKTKRDDIQILSNNETYQPLLDEYKRQGIQIDEDGCYEGKIKELQPIIDVLEKYIFGKNEKLKKDYKINMFDMTPDEVALASDGLTMNMIDKQENAYIFTTANIIKHLGNNVDFAYNFELNKYVFKLKEGKSLWVRGG